MFKRGGAKTVEEYLAGIEEPRRGEVEKLHMMIRGAASGLVVKMWNGVIGYGSYHYKYVTGREGDWYVIGLGSHKNYISVYVNVVEDGQYVAEKYKDELPGANTGKSCIRFKHIQDIDLKVLKHIVLKGVRLMTI